MSSRSCSAQCQVINQHVHAVTWCIPRYGFGAQRSRLHGLRKLNAKVNRLEKALIAGGVFFLLVDQFGQRIDNHLIAFVLPIKGSKQVLS